MMKKLIVLGIVVTMVMGFAAMASAAPPASWAVQLRATLSGLSAGNATFGTKATTGDVFSGTDGDAAYSPASGTWAEIYSSVADASSVVQLAKTDYKAPLTAANDSLATAKVWNLGIIASGAGTVSLIGWIPSSLKIADTKLVVDLYQGSQLLYAFNDVQKTGTSTAPNLTAITFNYDGQNPVALKLVAFEGGTPILPEPGSLVALFSGLVGLVGFGIRRRK